MELAHQYQSPPNCSIHRMSHCRSCKRYHLLTWILIDGFQSQEMIRCFLLNVLVQALQSMQMDGTFHCKDGK